MTDVVLLLSAEIDLQRSFEWHEEHGGRGD